MYRLEDTKTVWRGQFLPPPLAQGVSLPEEMKVLKIIVEKHPDGYVAYPLGLKGIVIAEGDTYEEALAEVKSAIQFHIETFGNDALENNDIMETFVAEVAV